MIGAGLAGAIAALGAGLSGFLRAFAQQAFVDFGWIGVMEVAAIVALVGSVLALMQHEAGPPIVAGAGTVIAVVVATTVTSKRFEMSEFLEDLPVRGPLFLAAGLAGSTGAVLGLISLRGRGKRVIGAVNSVLAVGVLACHAAVFRLDEIRIDFNVRPFLGVVVIVVVMVVGSFVGRAGAAVATAGAACLFPLYSALAEGSAGRREGLAAVAAAALAVIIVLSLVAVVLASREQTLHTFSSSPQPFEPTGFATPAYATPAYLTSGHATPAAGSAHPLPPIAEATTVSATGLFGQDTPTAESGVVASTGAQWVADPYGRHQMRYWDGRLWTQHVSDGGVAGTDPL